MDVFLSLNIAGLLDRFGSNPFYAMWFIFIHGGWIVFLLAIGWALMQFWLNWRQTLCAREKSFVVLAIDIPRVTEKDPGQSLRAVENMFAHLAGAHSPANWTDTWIYGKYQDPISCEIISIEGNVQFLIHIPRGWRDLVEASLFAQYPDAEITEVEDYAKKIPHSFPDPEWDLFGIEMIPAGKPSVYPLKTYPMFEHAMTGQLKDPLSVLLEGFSRLGPGEQAWLQLLILPIDQRGFISDGMMLIKKLKGENVTKPPSALEKFVMAPIKLLDMVLSGILGGGASSDKPKDAMPKIMVLSPGERKILEGVENKISKLAYLAKFRFLYMGKKEAFSKGKIVSSFVGFMKQMNTNDMLALKPEANHVGVNGSLWLLKDQRNNIRKTRLINAYAGRSIFDGMPPYYLNTEELATFWHFPHTFQVKTPQVKKRDQKTAEPPMNLPYAPN